MDDATRPSPAFALYGEGRIFPDVLHCETITARASRHDWKIARHRHPDLHQFFLFEAGAVTLRLRGGDRVLTPPVVISMPSQCDHGFAFAAGTEGLVVTVPTATLLNQAVLDLDRLHVGAVQTRVLLLFQAIASRHGAAGGQRDTALRALSVALACDLVGGDKPATARNPTATLFARFEAAIRDHAHENWRVADYAGHLGTSPTQLNRAVRAHSDQSVQSAVQAFQLGEAARRLAYTRQPVTTIAYDLGFSDPAYFARVFRKGLGVSPRAYRKRFD
ncbi:helix-turn-helix domain-containing protein [Loktanella sp. DJP18]|uniref:helix-turn-helix domain-containing protein n=1 Tax=Loktanella sp. DJP18 TaxID=3409788 RepID=UPI003BB68034